MSTQAVAAGLSVETRTYIHGLVVVVVVVVLLERIIRVQVGGGGGGTKGKGVWAGGAQMRSKQGNKREAAVQS